MKKTLLISLLILLINTLSAQEKNTQLLTLTLIETFRGSIPSKMILIYSDGTLQEEIPLENNFIPLGYRQKDFDKFYERLKLNEQAILKKLDDLQKAGWQLLSVSTNILRDGDTDTIHYNQVIYTRYIFKR